MSDALVRPEKLHGLVFDGAVLIGNLFLVGVVPRLGDDIPPAAGGLYLLGAVFTQLTGAWLKKRSLPLRRAENHERPRDGFWGGFFNILLFLHFLLFTLITLFSFTLFGITSLAGTETFFLGWMFGGFLISGLTTYLVWAAAKPPSAGENTPPGPPWLEYAGDALLWLSAMIITRVFWESLLDLIRPAAGIGFSGSGLALLAAMGVLFLFFYLPARYLFLIEDYRSHWTWLQMLAALLPVVGLIFL